jgi:hypothetical protein
MSSENPKENKLPTKIRKLIRHSHYQSIQKMRIMTGLLIYNPFPQNNP